MRVMLCDEILTSFLSYILNLILADPYFNKACKIDLLIAWDLFPKVLLPATFIGNCVIPNAPNTVFEYVIMRQAKCDRSVATSLSKGII